MKALVNKMVRIMADTKRIAKNGTNSFHNYQYVTEADVMESVRETLAKHNVFIFSSVEGSQRDGDMTSVVMRHTFVDGDTGETFEVKSLGQGQDKSDKGANKAITASMKYMLLKNLLISTGDDPEATDETGKSTGTTLKAVAKDSGPKKYGFSGKKVADLSLGKDGGSPGTAPAVASDEF
jgi:hypothetical protein